MHLTKAEGVCWPSLLSAFSYTCLLYSDVFRPCRASSASLECQQRQRHGCTAATSSWSPRTQRSTSRTSRSRCEAVAGAARRDTAHHMALAAWLFCVRYIAAPLLLVMNAPMVCACYRCLLLLALALSCA